LTKIYLSPGDPEYLFKEALGSGIIRHPDYSRIIYITPSTLRAIRAQKIFHNILTHQDPHLLSSTPTCYIPPDITTIDELSKRLHSLYGAETILPRKMIPVVISSLSKKGIGISVLISHLIRDFKSFHPSMDIEDIHELISRTTDELNLPHKLKASIDEAIEAFRVYQEYLRSHDLVDEQDLLNLCPQYIVKQRDAFKIAVIDGFYSPTMSEKLIIKEILNRAEMGLVSIPYIDGFDEIVDDYISFIKSEVSQGVYIERPDAYKGQDRTFSYHPYDDMESEVEGIARHIKALYRSGRISDLDNVIVAFPRLERYEPLIKRVFQRYGIPFIITSRRPAGKSRPIVELFCLLHSVSEDYPRIKFSQFLSSGYFGSIPESLREWIPTLSLQSGIISGKKAWLDFITNGNERFDRERIERTLKRDEALRLFEEPEDALLRKIEEIGRDIISIFRKIEPLEKIKEASSLTHLVSTLRAVLQDLRFLESIPSPDEPGSFSGERLFQKGDEIKKALIEGMEEISLLGDSELSLKEFSDYLGYILNNTYIREEGEGVIVTDLIGAFSASFLDHIYIGGLTDDDLPGRSDIDHILPESMTKRLGLNYLDRQVMIQRFLFEGIIRTARNIHLSYPLSESENKFLPSPFLYSAQAVKEKIPGLYSKNELLIRKATKPFSELISEIRIRQGGYHLKDSLNVTYIDSYRDCPRRFFIERVLGLEPQSIKEYKIEADVLGKTIHEIMEKIIFEPFEDIDYLKKRAAWIIEDILKGKNIDDFWKVIMTEAFIEILPQIYEIEKKIRSEGYKPIKTEKDISGEPIKGIKLKGKIDRIDASEKGIAIIDYKTGSRQFSCSGVLNGKMSIQLLLYAALLKTKGYCVDRVGTYSLRDLKITWCPPKKGKGVAVSMDDLITASLKALEDAVSRLIKGDFKAMPLGEEYYKCRRCHENPFCPYIQQ